MRISKLWLLALNEHGCVPTIRRAGELAFDVMIAARNRTRLIVITNLLFEEYSGVCGSERLVDASRPPNSHPGSAHDPSKHIRLCHLAALHSSTTRKPICLLRLVGEHVPKSPIGHGAPARHARVRRSVNIVRPRQHGRLRRVKWVGRVVTTLSEQLKMGQCRLCHRQSDQTSEALGLCAACVLADTSAARHQVTRAHARCRAQCNLPPKPPSAANGIRCDRCVNTCRIGPGQVGYCGVRSNRQGRLAGGDEESAAVQWYYDPLPTNCVADCVCPASGPAGYPTFTDTTGPEHGFVNLAVFYEACSFDCLFCQNWHFRTHSLDRPRQSAADLADAVTPRTRCICFFGGDPSCQIDHALAAARSARQKRAKDILRICWETNGSMSRDALTEAAELSLESGGCIKFDLKAWDDSVHRALCGVSNRRTLGNFEYLAGWIDCRPDPPFLIASTLLVPGYVDATQVGRIAEFIAGLNPTIPYALLAFRPAFQMQDLATTWRAQAADCLSAAQSAGLTRVRIGNVHLLA